MQETFEEVQTRHRKEQRDLQARVTQKKKSATKKTRKGVNSECEALELQLKERQDLELAGLNGEAVPEVDDVPELDEESNGVGSEPANTNGISTPAEAKTPPNEPLENDQPRKRNRAKERLARRAAEQEAAVVAAEEEAANQPSQKDIEHAAILKETQARGLVEKPIRPDGHCLFSAIADQLSQHNIPLANDSNGSIKEDQRYILLRKAAAKYIEDHSDDFEAWLEEPLPAYVSKIRDTAEWGGHLELLALAKAYNVEICVIQDGAPEHIKPDTKATESEQIWLAYYRHGYGLGEHYNSLRKAP